MLDRLHNEGFIARLKDTFGLVRSTLSVFGKDADIIKPIIGMIVLRSIASSALLIGLALFIFAAASDTGSLGWGFLLMLIAFLLAPLTLFYDAFQRAKISALGYDVARGEDATIPKAKARIKGLKGTLFLVGLIDSMMASAKNRSNSKGGITGFIVAIAVMALTEVWDLVSNFLLPAVVIEQKGARAVVGDLKELKRNAPAAVVGVLGFDAFGSLARTIVSGIYLVLGALGIALPIYLFGATLLTLTVTLVTLGLIAVLSAIISKLVVGAKSVYFTLFYLALVRPHEICAPMRKACTNLLPAEVAGSSEEATTQESGPDLADIVSKLRGRGGTSDQIRTFLTQRGFSADDVERAIRNTQAQRKSF